MLSSFFRSQLLTQRWLALLLALLVLVGLLVWGFMETALVASEEASSFAPDSFPTGMPVHLSIERLGIATDITPGIYDHATASWNVSGMSSHFATVSSEPSSVAGMTLIYAHNTRSLFGPLEKLTTGDLVNVRVSSGATFSYRYVSKETVSPATTDIFSGASQGSPRLVLLTCSGSWNQKRLLATFEFIGASL